MPQHIVIIGAGFAGVWSALSAKRLIDSAKRSKSIEVTVVAPKPSLVVRPRLYEANPSTMFAPLEQLFATAGIKFIQGAVGSVDTEQQTIKITSNSGTLSEIEYDRLILAAGSSVVKPKGVSGLEQHAFDIDSIEGASKLDVHLEKLGARPESDGRDTIVVCGAGFTGIELITELPKRVGTLLSKPRLVIVDSADVLGSTLGPGPRPVIEQAMRELGIEVRLGSSITSVDSGGLTLASGERIQSKTVIWTAGVRASQITEQIAGPKDNLSRLYVDDYLRIPSSPHIYATGDCAAALADAKGHFALTSCQHALVLGRVSGNNAAADLLNIPLEKYAQDEYVTCLDLGAWGTVVTYGWDREVKLTGNLAKRVKMYINQTLIYPPQDAKTALAMAGPAAVSSSSELLQQILDAVA